jgi:hypothetical protein
MRDTSINVVLGVDGMGAAVNGPDLGSLPELGCKEVEREMAPRPSNEVGREMVPCPSMDHLQAPACGGQRDGECAARHAVSSQNAHILTRALHSAFI